MNEIDSARPAKEWKPYVMLGISLLLIVSLLGFDLIYHNSSLRPIFDPVMPWLALALYITGIAMGHIALSRFKLLRQDSAIGCVAHLCLIIGYCWIFAYLADPFRGPRITERGYITKTMHNAKQVIIYLKLFASDQTGSYPDAAVPDARTSNDIFRQIFKVEIAENEMVFGGCISPFRPDGNIGTKPDFSEAVKAGENHWAMTKGLTDSDPAKMPMIFENPSEATWPPKWNADLAMQPKPGRTWSKGRIIVGFNDGSVELLPLESDRGKSVGLKPRADGTPIFPILPGRKLEVLNVAK